MCGFSLVSKKKRDHLSSILLSDFIIFCSFILSHPLYLSYFIFFSPYLLKIFAFLSPIFITTTLVVVAFVTLSLSTPSALQFPETETYQTLSCDGLGCLEQLEVYKMVFETTDVDISTENPQQAEEEDDQSKQEEEGESQHSDARPETKQVMAVVKLFEDLKEGVENMSSKKREKSLNVEPDEVGGWEKGNQSKMSMRKEKEWRRTLACKLFEERHNVNMDASPGGEGMDLLWETYNRDDTITNNKVQVQVQLKSSSKKNKGYLYNDESEYEEDDSDGQLCCLQALKFSSGKMNLGRPNLVKISKALKGFGWLHHVSTKHGKKGYR